MGTAEMMIVFSALMALIALVTIGIDWIGKPLKHRRFIPRIYRFDDEKLPVDEYGNTTFVTELDEQQPPLLAMYQPGPQTMAAAQAQHHPMAQPLASTMLPTQSTEAERTVAIAAQPSPRYGDDTSLFSGGSGVAQPIEAIGNIIDSVFTSDEERAQGELLKQKLAMQPSMMQAEIMKVQANHRSTFVC